ncbi:EAL domain-containing protein [Aeromonas allosaccharophila]|uniref:bifunctional diguanylate cyclase/phosphodiesterase n=1 Tax=Aeromonas allosaccharophila TaxID=656 RepID=UPI000694F6F2|nr:EAL domain-containing protein [Aeromonas allosaccharophila]
MVRLNSLRNKVSLYLLLLISCAAAISYGVSTAVLSANTRLLSEHNQQAALDRAQLYIESMQKSLIVSTRDYAEWRDSIRFIKGNLPTYLDENFNAGTLDNLNAHFVLFIKPDHSLYHAIGRGGATYVMLGDAHPIWSKTQAYLTHYWSSHSTRGYALNGWFQKHPILLAIHPVHDPDVTAQPMEGWIVMIRELDGASVQQVREMTKLDLEFLRDTREAPQTEQRALPDSENSGRLILRVPADHQLLAQQRLSNRMLLINSTLLLIAAGLGTITIYERMVMRRLAIFTRLAEQYSSLQPTGKHWPLSGNPEFDTLARALNSMVEQLQQSEQALYNEARRDGLTQLGNRKCLSEQLNQHPCLLSKHDRCRIALLMIDLDDFKTLNDSLGHEQGDQVLLTIAECLKQVIRGEDMLFRIGGDEFAIITKMVREEEGAITLAERLMRTISDQQIEQGGRKIQVSASIGIAYDDGAMGADELIRNADLAMYDAKQAGKHCYRCYREILHQQLSQRMQLEQALREALQLQQLEVWYQPIMDVTDDSIAMVEALCRWPTPTGFCSPSVFIPLAEQAGLIVPMGKWIAEQAMGALRELRHSYPDLNLNINLSVLQLMEPDLVPQLAELTDHHQLPRSAIHFELTESLFAESHGQLEAQLLALTQAGFKIHLDDFGTGYSSLERLLSLPIDAIKLDYSFTQTLQKGDERLVKAVLLLGRELEMPVIAEGVETDEVRMQLSRLGCHLMQGYLFAHPMNKTELTQWLALKTGTASS